MEKLSIIIPSYNKGKYISDALDSIFMQKTDFLYKIIIADDASTDNTLEILDKYQQKYPKKISVLPSKKNQGLYRNILRAYELLTTEYFCVLDPDDYWTDLSKIQSALSFLDSNPNYHIYMTNTAMSDTGKPYVDAKIQERDVTFNDLLQGNAIMGCTLGNFFRNSVFSKGIPDKMLKAVGTILEQAFRGDSFRNLLHLHEGKARFVNKVDSVYRITEDGLWQSSSSFRRNNLNAAIFTGMYDFFEQKYPELYIQSYKLWKKNSELIINHLEKESGSLHIEDKDWQNFMTLTQRYIQRPPITEKKNKQIKLKYKIYIKIYGWLHKKLSKKQLL